MTQTAGQTVVRLDATGTTYDSFNSLTGDIVLNGGAVVVTTDPASSSPAVNTTYDVLTGWFLTDNGVTVVDVSPANTTFTKSVVDDYILRLTAVAAANWTGSTSSDWATASNWTTGTVPNAAGAKAHFGSSPSTSTVTLSSGVTVGVLNLTNSSGYTVNGSGPLTFDQSVAGAPVAINSMDGNHTLSVPVVLGKDMTATVANNLTLSGNVSGSGSLAKAGTGTLLLSGTNTYAGPTRIDAGTVKLSGGAAIPDASAVTLTGTGTLDLNGSSETIGSLSSGATGTLVKLGTGTLTVGGNNASTAYKGVVEGSGSLVKTGTGTMTLSGTNTYTGGTTINDGAIVFDSADAIGGSGANVTVGPSGTAAAGYAINQTFVGRITTGSTGTVALAADSDHDLDFTGRPDLTLGAVGTAAYSGALTPASTTYKLGGGGGTLYVNSTLSGSTNDVAVYGPGTVALTGTNTYGGKTTLNGGTLQVSYDSNLGAVPTSAVSDSISVPSGKSATLQLSAEASTLFDPNFTYDTVTPSNNPVVGSVTLDAHRGLTVDGALSVDTYDASKSLTILGAIAGSGSLAKVGEGTLVLDATNMYSGATTVSAGVLQFNSSSAIAGTGRTVAVDTDATAAAGYAMNQGFLDRLTTTSTGTAAMTVDSSNNLSFASLPDVSLGAVGNVTYSGTLTPNGSGVYMLGGGGGALTVASTLSGSNGVTVSHTGTVVLAGTNTYSGQTRFLGSVASVSASSNLGDGSSTNTLLFDGGTLRTTADLTLSRNATLSGTGGAIDTGGHTVTYSGVASGSGPLTKAGMGTLVLSSANTHTGVTAIADGTLNLAHSSALQSSTLDYSVPDGALSFGSLTSVTLGGLSGNRNLDLANDSAAAVALTVGGNDQSVTYTGSLTGPASSSLTKTGTGTQTVGNVRLPSVTVSTGTLKVAENGTDSGTSRLSSLSVSTTNSARLDLADNDLIIDYSSTSPLSSIKALLASGYNSDSWTGVGITSSAAAASGHYTALGYGEASTVCSISGGSTATWSGQTVDATTLLVKYTYAGDVNLDGMVDLLDLNSVNNNFGMSSAVWTDGDLNYNGTIDLGDLNAVLNNFGAGTSGDALASLVPEPTGLGLLMTGAMALGSRRRRR